MNAVKTTALVEDSQHLKLLREIKDLKKGTHVDLVIITKKSYNRNQWKQVLSEIGTYSEKDLNGFEEVRKGFDKWNPPEF